MSVVLSATDSYRVEAELFELDRSAPGSERPQQPQVASAPGAARVQITSSPSGGEIYIDGKFFGNAPSDIALRAGEHVVRVTLGGKEWTRTVQITGGEIQLRAELP